MRNANLPAMPTQDVNLDAYHGLTKREMFAMAAMQGMLAKEKYSVDYLAQESVAYAEAVLAELERTK